MARVQQFPDTAAVQAGIESRVVSGIRPTAFDIN
jgi:hypothetical protein